MHRKIILLLLIFPLCLMAGNAGANREIKVINPAMDQPFAIDAKYIVKTDNANVIRLKIGYLKSDPQMLPNEAYLISTNGNGEESRKSLNPQKHIGTYDLEQQKIDFSKTVNMIGKDTFEITLDSQELNQADIVVWFWKGGKRRFAYANEGPPRYKFKLKDYLKVPAQQDGSDNAN